MIVSKCPANGLRTKYSWRTDIKMPVWEGHYTDYCHKYNCFCKDRENCIIKDLILYCCSQDLPEIYELMGIKNEDNN